MMENKTSISKIFHAAIKTKHVFIKDEQVFLKKDNQEAIVVDTNGVEWFPTRFKWMPTTS